MPSPARPPVAGRAPGTAPAWPAWLGAGACGLLAAATGVQWFGGGFAVDGLDIPLAVLFSDTPTEGVPIGVVFIVVAAAALALALARPEARALAITFIAAGATSTLVAGWYMIRVLSSLQEAPLFDALSIGFWLALLASLSALAAGVALWPGARGRGAA